MMALALVLKLVTALTLMLCQNAIYEREMPNNESVPGLTEILWQHRSDGWAVRNQ